MKVLLISFVFGLGFHAQAFPVGAELEESAALAQPRESNNKNAPTTSIVFRLATPQGEVVSLVEQNAKLLVRPASTMKLFTGWMALQKGVQTDEYLTSMLQTSNNAQAERTLRLLGGAAQMTAFYRDLGLEVNGQLRIVDGSGLSKANRSNCHIQLELLNYIRQTPDFERFRNLLATPGAVGTLDDRLLDFRGRLFGKTGTLRTTIALTGFVESTKGTVMFCVISEFFSRTWPQERARIDAIVRERVTALEESAR